MPTTTHYPPCEACDLHHDPQRPCPETRDAEKIRSADTMRALGYSEADIEAEQERIERRYHQQGRVFGRTVGQRISVVFADPQDYYRAVDESWPGNWPTIPATDTYHTSGEVD